MSNKLDLSYRYKDLMGFYEEIKSNLPKPLPCPFCGYDRVMLEGYKEVNVVCGNRECYAEGPQSQYGLKDPMTSLHSAITLWNTRKEIK
jgi:hypothetical protein